MSSSFTVAQRNQEIAIDLRSIYAIGQGSGGILRIPIQLDLRNGYGLNPKWQLSAIEAVLGIVGKSHILDKCLAPAFIPVSNELRLQMNLDFNLSMGKLELIERDRIEDVEFIINMTIFYCEVFEMGGGGELQGRSANVNSHIQFNVPQSIYINKILNPLCNDPISIIEVPTNLNDIYPGLQSSVNELMEAVKYFNKGDYDKVISHCRTAIEPINRDFQKIKRKFESRSETKWLKEVAIESFTWLDKMCASTSEITSKTHHAPSIGHFSRNEAKALYLTTVAILTFISGLNNS